MKKRVTSIAAIVVQAVLTLFVISVLVFAVTQGLPGDVATIIGGREATEEQLATIREQLGLNQPLKDQYLDWITGVIHGDFGTSMVTGFPVSDELRDRAFNSFALASTSLVITIVLSICLGVFAAWRRDKLGDRIVFGASIVGSAVPDFLVGAFLIFMFATYVFHWLPAVATISPGENPWGSPEAMVMPCLTLIIPGTAYLSRLVRIGMIDILNGPYIRLAYLKGLKPRRVLFRHALPNALSATVPAFSLVAAIMVSAVAVVEYLFNYPGIGGLLLEAINTRDLPTIQGAALVIGVTVYLLNLLADLLSRRFSI